MGCSYLKSSDNHLTHRTTAPGTAPTTQPGTSWLPPGGGLQCCHKLLPPTVISGRSWAKLKTSKWGHQRSYLGSSGFTCWTVEEPRRPSLDLAVCRSRPLVCSPSSPAVYSNWVERMPVVQPSKHRDLLLDSHYISGWNMIWVMCHDTQFTCESVCESANCINTCLKLP